MHANRTKTHSHGPKSFPRFFPYGTWEKQKLLKRVKKFRDGPAEEAKNNIYEAKKIEEDR